MSNQTRPLAGVRVCAFTHVAAGPFAVLQLAYLGAEVIKVESKTRIDYWRYRDRNDDPEGSRPFTDHNKNVRSVTLNLKSPQGITLAHRLAAVSDVAIDNYSAGVMDRLGLGFAELQVDRPDIIVVHLTGLGTSGPRSSYVTFGPSLMSYCGMTRLWNHPGQAVPVGSQSSYPDFLAGTYAAFAIVAALHRRASRREPQLLDFSQAMIAAAALGPSYATILNGGSQPQPLGNTSPEHAPYGCYPCRGGDDRWCVIAVESDEQWLAFRHVMGQPEWAMAVDLASEAGRIRQRSALDERVAYWTQSLSPREVMLACQAQGVPAGVVTTGEDLYDDPQLAARGFFAEGRHPRLGALRLPGSPVRFRGQSTDVWRFGPLLGQDNDYVLRDVLGLGPEQIAAHNEAGALD